MLFSVDYKSDRLEQADEIRCPVNQLGLIYDFIKEHPDKRYVVTLNTLAEDDQLSKVMEQVDYIKAVNADYTICCNSMMEVDYLIANGYNAYLNMPITDWETFNIFAYNHKVSDILIDGPLGFQAEDLKIASNDVVIRTILNYADIYKANSFFIRPEDIELYDEVITVCETLSDIIFDIYKRGVFNQDIHYLVTGLPEGINNSMISYDFGEHRLNCGQRCMVPSKHCCWCDTELNIVRNSTKLLGGKADD